MTNASQIGLLQVLRPCLITTNYIYIWALINPGSTAVAFETVRSKYYYRVQNSRKSFIHYFWSEMMEVSSSIMSAQSSEPLWQAILSTKIINFRREPFQSQCCWSIFVLCSWKRGYIISSFVPSFVPSTQKDRGACGARKCVFLQLTLPGCHLLLVHDPQTALRSLDQPSVVRHHDHTAVELPRERGTGGGQAQKAIMAWAYE